MRFWFVNLGKYYREQRNGGYLWAPLKNKSGNREPYWETLRNVNPGDVILCNNNGRIVSIGVAVSSAYMCDIPAEFKQIWRPEGRGIDVNFIDLDHPFKCRDYKDYILTNINPKENPFNVHGNAKQGYLFPLDEVIAKFILNKISNDKIKQFIHLSDEALKDRLDEILEEKKQFEEINDGSINAYSDEELWKLETQSYHYDANSANSKRQLKREKTDPRLKITRIKKSDYLCEISPEHKTFLNTSGKHQYLEVHHIIPLNAQKDYCDTKLDSLFNLIALCPICHTQVHYACKKQREEIFLKMYNVRKEEMLKHDFDLQKVHDIFNKYYLNKMEGDNS